MPRGYTLLEAIVTLSLATVLLGASVPAFNMLARLSIKEDAEKVVSMVVRAKNLSILEGSDYYVQFQPYSLSLAKDSGEQLYRYHIKSSTHLDQSNSFRIKIFNGGVATPRTITLSLKGISCSVVITLRGRARATC